MNQLQAHNLKVDETYNLADVKKKQTPKNMMTRRQDGERWG